MKEEGIKTKCRPMYTSACDGSELSCFMSHYIGEASDTCFDTSGKWSYNKCRKKKNKGKCGKKRVRKNCRLTCEVCVARRS